MGKTKKRMGYISWTEERIKLLKELHATNGNKELAELFGVSVKAIETRAVKLMLKKDKETISKIHKQGQHNREKKAFIFLPSGCVMKYMPEHPFCDERGYIRENRFMMEQKLGRYLKPNEIVTHKNGDVGDNAPENLQVESFYRSDVLPLDVFNDRKKGMQVLEIRKKYGISINTYYRKLEKGKKISLEIENNSLK